MTSTPESEIDNRRSININYTKRKMLLVASVPSCPSSGSSPPELAQNHSGHRLNGFLVFLQLSNGSLQKTKIQHISILSDVEEVELHETCSVGVDLRCVVGNDFEHRSCIGTLSKSNDENRVFQRQH